MPIRWKIGLRRDIQRRYLLLASILWKYIPECLPPVEACDHLSYLVLETSFYTKDQFKNSWSLPAYSHVVSGLIKDVFGQIVQEKYVVLAKVRHSHRMNDPRVQLWIITTKQGSVVLGHCVGCRAGLGKCGSHIASVLFYLEIWTRMKEKLSCTRVKCTWLLQRLRILFFLRQET